LWLNYIPLRAKVNIFMKKLSDIKGRKGLPS